MLSLRRVPNPIRNQYISLVGHTFYTKVDASSNSENGHHRNSNEHRNNEHIHLMRPLPHKLFSSAASLVWGRNISSGIGAKDDKDEDLEDGFSELDDPPETDKSEELEVNGDNDLESEGDSTLEDYDDAVEDVVGSVDKGANYGKREVGRYGSTFPLFKIILNSNRYSLYSALDKWVEEKNPLGRSEISLTLMSLRKRRLYGKALQLLEWLDMKKHMELEEHDYASRLDLVAKVHGLLKAEKYIDRIPQPFRSELIYRTFLANCVIVVNVKKAEEVFNKMRDFGFPISTFACNQLILLYKRVDRKKIADVLKLMEKEDVKPSLFTYKLLVDTKGRIHDIQGMEDVIATMKSDGIEPDIHLQSIAVRHYIFAGYNEKAEAALKEIEADDLKKNRATCRSLIPLYAALNKAEDVGRIWKVCEPNPNLEECCAAVEAWGKLGEIENAEKVFDQMMKSYKNLSSKYYNVLLKVYANHKLLSKGKDLAKRLSDSNCRIGPFTWDTLVKLYADAGEVEKANSILEKASEQNQLKPLFSSYVYVLEKYAERGDVHNSEKIFNSLRQIGYVGRIRQYQLLLQAYINAKVPAYGFTERMKADNVFPSKTTFAQLQAVDPFRKTQLSELLG